MSVFYITTPIYYPNDQPHIGHAYTTIMADVIARWHRLKGEDVFFLTGTDEHGLKLQREAEKHGMKPKEFVDMMVEYFKKYWRILEIEYTRFIRTTDKDHEETVRKALMEIYRKGLIYKSVYKGWYCTSCEKFYSKGEYIERNGKKLCPTHLRPLEWVEEEAYFLKLSEYTDKVLSMLRKDIVVPSSYANEIISKIEREGLKDLGITRPKSRVYWGIEAPWDTQHTIYVWIDALLNYLTAIGYGKDEEKFRRYWSVVHHVIGKDILWFHTAVWFALLAMLDIPPPRKLIVHGFILMKGIKMSKSLGNIVTIDDLLNTYGGADPVRYLLMRFMSLEKDFNYDPKLLISTYNAELADTLGNLVRRVAVLSLRKLKGIVEQCEVDKQFASFVESKVKEVSILMDRFRLSEALVAIFDILREANAYLNRTEPWRLDNPSKPLYNVLEAIRIASILLTPFMPATMKRLSSILGYSVKSVDEAVFGIHECYHVKEAPILFAKIR